MKIRAFDLVTSQPWAIAQSALEEILAIAERHEQNIDMLATRIGEPLNHTHNVEVRNGVAVVPITGPIFQRANLLTEISGATSTEILATDIQAALDDPAVRRIVLNVDSPGGAAAGINELGNLIFAARAIKPIEAYIGGNGQSAAYWIASATSRITVDATAFVGSIGTVITMLDSRGRDAKDGVRRIEFVSSVSPAKRPDLETDAGRAQMQQLADDLGEIFVAAVARNRGASVDTVLEKFGRGASFVGEAAVRAGLVDGLSSLEHVIGGNTRRALPPLQGTSQRRATRAEIYEARARHTEPTAETVNEIFARRAKEIEQWR